MKKGCMGHKSWCFKYDPETKRHSATWSSSKKPQAQKVRLQKSWVKIMLTASLDAKGIIQHQFVLVKQNVNSKFYKEMSQGLLIQLQHIRH
jgi:hypothetical protein